MALVPLARQGINDDFLDGCADMGPERVARYMLYQAYYDGEKGAKLRDRALEYLQRQSRVPFCENFVEPVVDALAERLEVVGFTADTGDEDDPVAKLAGLWWQRNRMDDTQATVHRQALVAGDEFVIVEWNPQLGMPRFCRQRPEQIKPVYSDDDPTVVEYAVKKWNSRTVGPQNPAGDRIQRMNVYWPDRVEKWFRPTKGAGADGSGGWERWRDVDDVAWPVPWVDVAGEPLGVPVVHFRNRPDGCYGRSRVRPAIPFQEQLNKYAADLNDLIDNHAMPQDTVTGVTGDVEFKRVPGNVWQASSKEVLFGRLEASPTDNLLAAIEGVISRLARRSRVPMHLLTGGTPPSGEALKTSESGLVAVAREAQVAFGNSWEDVITLGLRLAATFGNEPPRDELVLSTEWTNPETRSDKSDVEVAEAKHRLGVSRATLLGELGYDATKEQELRSMEADEGAEAFARVLDRGGPLIA